MVVHISSALLDAILAHAASAPGVEVCGLLFGTDRAIESVVATSNVHADPAGHFEVDPTALIAAHRTERAGGPRLVGHYHSHPSGSSAPSREDVRSTEEGRLSLIVGGSAVGLYRCIAGDLVETALTVSHRDNSQRDHSVHPG
jgi:proteasome lid subunit RPN8/RPN11